MRKKTKKILSIFALSSIIVLTTIAVSSYYLLSKNKAIFRKLQFTNDNVFSDSTLKKGLISPNLNLNASNQDLVTINSNEYWINKKVKVEQFNYNNYLLNNKNQFLNNVVKKNIKNFSINDFQKDVLFFLKNLYTNSNELLSINLNESKFEYDEKNDLISGNFNFDLINSNNKTIDIFLINKSINLEPFEKKNISFDFKNQNYNFVLNKFGDDQYFLGWKTNFSLKIDNVIELVENFSFTKNNKSIALPLLVLGITDKDNYLNIVNDVNNYKNVDLNFLKKNFDYKIEKNINLSINLIKLLSSLIQSIKTNPTIEDFLKNISSDIIFSLNQNLNFPSKFNKILKIIIESKQPIINIIDENKSIISSLISFLINDPSVTDEAIFSFLKPIKPSLSKNELDSQIQYMNKLINYFLNSTNKSLDLSIVNEIIEFALRKNTTSLDFLGFLFSNYKKRLINLLDINLNQYNSFDFIFDLIKLFVTKKSNEKVLDILVYPNSKNELNLIFKKIMYSFNPLFEFTGFSKFNLFLDQVLNENNLNFNVINFQKFIDEILVKLLNYFSDQNNWNLIIQTPKFDFVKNKLSFNYKLIFEFKTKLTIKFDSLFGLLPDYFEFGKLKVPKSVFKTFLEQSNNSLTHHFLGLNDKLIIEFFTKDSLVHLTPKKIERFASDSNTDYFASYSIFYAIKIKFRFNNFFNSINSFYKRGDLKFFDNSLYDFFKQVLEYFFLIDHYFHGIFNIDDKTILINNYYENILNFDNNIKFKKLDKNKINEIKKLIKIKDNNKYELTTSVNGKTEKDILVGKQPYFSEHDIQKIKNLIFENNGNIDPVFLINPSISANVNFKIFDHKIFELPVVSISIWIWYPVNVFDMTDNKNIKLSNFFKINLLI